MVAPRLPADMVEDASQQLEQYFKTLDRLAVSKKTARSRFVHWDAIARTYFYLGQDDEAQSYFYQSIEGAKVFHAEKSSKLEVRPSSSFNVRGLYDIARPLWWIGDVTCRDYFEQAIEHLKKGREHELEYERRRSLTMGIAFLITIDEMERARPWLDELEYKYGLLGWQKALEVYRMIVEHSPSSSNRDLQVAFDQKSRLMKLDRSKPYYSSPTHGLVVYEWLRRQLES